MQLGPGHKRKSAETDIFKELRVMQNGAYSDDDSDEAYDPRAIPEETHRRKYADPQEEEKAMAAQQAAAVPKPMIKRVQRNNRRKVAFEDEEEEESKGGEDDASSSDFSPSSGEDCANDSEWI